MPHVNVIMPVRNGELFLTDAVQSILKQTFRDFEFLICDDASTDDTPRILRRFRDPRIRLVHNRRKMGVARSLNRLLKQTRGTLVARMDGDDISLRDRLERQVMFLRKHPAIGMLGTWFAVIDENNHVRKKVHFPATHAAIRRALPRFNPIRHPTMLVRKAVFAQLHGYDPTMEGAEDYDLVIRASRITTLANLPIVLLQHRSASPAVSVDEEYRIHRASLRARLAAFARGDFQWWERVYLVKPIVALFLPRAVKEFLRSL